MEAINSLSMKEKLTFKEYVIISSSSLNEKYPWNYMAAFNYSSIEEKFDKGGSVLRYRKWGVLNRDYPTVLSTQNEKLVSQNSFGGGNDKQLQNITTYFRINLSDLKEDDVEKN